MDITLYTLAQRFVGEVHELPGGTHNDPAIVWFQQSCHRGIVEDETPWCSGFINRMAWVLRLPRSKSLAARSWLEVGTPTTLEDARVGWDVVILKRGPSPQPGPEVTSGAPGHVGLYAGVEVDEAGHRRVLVLGGNQGNQVSIASFPLTSLLGIRRLHG